MFGLALGVHNLPERLPAIVYALLSGLNASTVGIVALAAVQLAEKAIKDKITRVLVVFGGCAGLCYNAIWYFPVLIAVGGAVTVVWDLWGMQRVGKVRAGWRKRKNGGGGGGGKEEEEVGRVMVQSIPLETMRPEAAMVKRRTQAGVSTMESERGDGGGAAAASTAAERTQAVEHVQMDNPPVTPVPDTKTHNISVKLGISLIAGFFASFIMIMVIRATVSNGRPFNLFSNM